MGLPALSSDSTYFDSTLCRLRCFERATPPTAQQIVFREPMWSSHSAEHVLSERHHRGEIISPNPACFDRMSTSKRVRRESRTLGEH